MGNGHIGNFLAGNGALKGGVSFDPAFFLENKKKKLQVFDMP